MIKNVRTVFNNNYIAGQVVDKQFGLKNNNYLLPVVVVDFARVELVFELLQYYSSQEKYLLSLRATPATGFMRENFLKIRLWS